MKPPKGPPVFSQFDHGIYWKYHGNIVGYDGIYRYNLCMRYRGWLPNSTPVEGCGKKPMGFNHPKVVQDFARIHCSSFLLSQNSGFSTWTRLHVVFIALTCSVLWNCSPYSCPFANGPSSICSGSRTASISSSPTRSPGDSLGDFPLGNGHGAMKCGVHNPFLNKILNVIPKKCHTSWKISDKLIYPLVPSGKRLWKITTISMGKSTISIGSWFQ